MACLNCGFDLAEEGKRCEVCGSDSIAPSEAATNLQPLEEARTVRHATPSKRGGTFLAAGDVFAGRYEVAEPLGRGGMGAVYRARDRRSGEERALKILHATADDDHAVVRFRREIEILSRLRHPTVVDIVDWGVHDGKMYFAAELIEGENLRAVLKQRVVFTPKEAAEIGATLAEALHAAHTSGVVHRDIKPHNVMMSADGRIKLLDFGIARGAGIDMNTVTATGVMVGTPEYMSPEQFQGIRVDARSDIYSLGVVLYELLAGTLPFQGDTPVALGIRHQTALPPLIRPQRPNVPAWLERVILKCLEKQPGDRFSSAEELAKELSRVRQGEKRMRTLPSGDQLVEDDSESEEWALTLVTTDERTGWTVDMALQFEDRFYRLGDVRTDGSKWFYRFSFWPDEMILRKVIDYDRDLEERRVQRRGLREKFRDRFGF